MGTVAKNHSEKSLLSHIRSELALSNVKINDIQSKTVIINGNACDGVFQWSGIPHIRIAKNSPQYLFTLTHEFCHFLQWREKSKLWSKVDRTVQHYEDWLAGNSKLSSRKIAEYRNGIVEFERDCEVRVMNLLDAFRIDYDRVRHVQTVNRYLLYIHYVSLKREWDNRMFGEDSHLLFPKKLLSMSTLRNPSPKYKRYFDRYFGR